MANAKGEEFVTDQRPVSSLLLDMVIGKWVAQAICATAELGIADLLKDGPLSIAEIAVKTGASEDGVYRLLRALVHVGLFVESERRRFGLTSLATGLRSDAPGSVRGFARFLGDDLNSRPWGRLVDSVKTGRPAFDLVFGMPVFDYVTKHPESAAIFNEAMTSLSQEETVGIVDAYDFEGIRTLVDVGGGQGRLLAAILNANPRMRGVLFEMPHALEGARKLLGHEGVIDRCEVVGGDFFTEVPEGGDAYVMKRILHDWDDERAIRILQNCHEAMRPGGRILVVDVVIDSANNSTFASFLDLEMLVVTPSGRERAEQEFQKLYADAGFRLSRVITTGTPVSIVEGTAV